MLATIVKRFRLDVRPGERVEPIQRVTLRPKNGLPVVLRRR